MYTGIMAMNFCPREKPLPKIVKKIIGTASSKPKANTPSDMICLPSNTSTK